MKLVAETAVYMKRRASGHGSGKQTAKPGGVAGDAEKRAGKRDGWRRLETSRGLVHLSWGPLLQTNRSELSASHADLLGGRLLAPNGAR